ncbi:conserved protein of unknown function [Ectopseudomonas oleovorans]|uniref:Uncharacterized protein n=1 Tax=Ectopseudomonas oleovorans TaxID=301 RepID=A0A653B0F0_ECTOL|nr:conserved protein of unknown function [Pseudomonas oleovorans]
MLFILSRSDPAWDLAFLRFSSAVHCFFPQVLRPFATEANSVCTSPHTGHSTSTGLASLLTLTRSESGTAFR